MTRIRQGFTLVRPSSLPLACCSSMAEARLGLNAQLHTPPLPATHVSAGTDSDTNPKASRYDYLFTRSTSLRTSDLTPRSKLWGKDCLPQAPSNRSKLSPATVLRPDRGHRVGQGSDPPFYRWTRREWCSTPLGLAARAPAEPPSSSTERPDRAQARRAPRRPQAAVRTRPPRDRDDQDASSSATSGTSRNARSRSSTIRVRSVVRSLPLCPRASIRAAVPAAASGSFASA